jgi:hypothetical protein
VVTQRLRFDEAYIDKLDECWQFLIWAPKENTCVQANKDHVKLLQLKRDKAAYLEIYANLQQGKIRQKLKGFSCFTVWLTYE